MIPTDEKVEIQELYNKVVEQRGGKVGLIILRPVRYFAKGEKMVKIKNFQNAICVDYVMPQEGQTVTEEEQFNETSLN